MKQPINFPMIISLFLMGLENRISIVSDLNSLLKLLIQIAGNRKIKIIGHREKNAFRSAKPAFSILNWVSKIHVNNVVVVKNIVMIL